MAEIAFVTWFTLIEYLAAIFSQSFSLYVFGGIAIRRCVTRKQSTVEISRSMNVYIFMQIFTSVAALTYLIYLLTGWRLACPAYNAYWMFFTGAAQTSFLTLMPLAILGLGLDRCLYLVFPMKYGKERTWHLVVVTFVAMFLLITCSIIFRIIPAYPESAATECLSFGCLTTPSGGELYAIARYSTSSLILLVSGFLLYLLKWKLQIQFTKNRAAKVSFDHSEVSQLRTFWISFFR